MPPLPETASDRYTAASGLASAVGECADQFGIDIIPICKALNIDPATFSDLTGRVSLDRLCRLMETCAIIANDDCFGLKTIEFFRPGASGPYGFGLISAPTALHFFRFMGEHQSYVAAKSYSKLTTSEIGVELAWTYPALIVKRDQFVDMSVGLVLARLRNMLGASIDQVDVGLERPKPKNPAFFREKMTKKVTFSKRINSLTLPSVLFPAINPQADERLFKLMDLQCRALRPNRPDGRNFTEEIREFVLSRIAESTIGLSEAADYFHVSERTLQRRLSEAGTSLNDLRDDVRRSLAERLLIDTDLSASEIAVRLGYSASSAFSRSTVRWFGTTPRAYRKTGL